MGEDLVQVLGVEVGQRAGLHVLPAELVALHVCVLHAGLAHAVELAVQAHAGESDAVVDLADLVERRVGVLAGQHDAFGIAGGDEGPSAGDVAAGELRLLPNQLLGVHVEVGHRHGRLPPLSALGLGLDDGGEALGHLVLGNRLEAGGRDRGDGGIDAAHHVGAARGGVLVGRLVEAFDGELYRLITVHIGAVPQLDRRAGVATTGPSGVEVGFFVAPARDVVLVDAAHMPAQVVTPNSLHASTMSGQMMVIFVMAVGRLR